MLFCFPIHNFTVQIIIKIIKKEKRTNILALLFLLIFIFLSV